MINYICGKGFLILESSTDKSWWWKRQARGEEKKKRRKRERTEMRSGPYQTFRDRFRLYARLAE